MTPEIIIRSATKDGVRLTIASNGDIRVAGRRSAVRRWRPILRERKAEVLAILGLHQACSTEHNGASLDVPHCWWRIHYADHAPLEIAYCPPASQVKVKAGEPDAVAVEPFVPISRQADAPLSRFQEVLIRRWLAEIGETDIDTIEELLYRCQMDADAREYFLELAEQMKQQRHVK